MDHSEDNHVDQPALTDDQEQIDAMANESPALRRFEERAEEEAELEDEAAEAVAEGERAEADADEQALEDEPTSSADDLSARSGGPDAAEDVEAVVEDEEGPEAHQGGPDLIFSILGRFADRLTFHPFEHREFISRSAPLLLATTC